MQPTECPAIELGVIVAGPLDLADRRAIDAAIAAVQEQLEQRLSDFVWQFEQVRRDEWADDSRIEPTDLLQQAREKRDDHGWDFAFVLTAADLVSYYKPFALGIISRALDVAVISTARIDPRAKNPDTQDDDRTEAMRKYVRRLMLHTLGHWLGLGHDPDPKNSMHDIDSVEALPGSEELNTQQLNVMRETLQAIADQRLEERPNLRAAWENRAEIFDAVTQARPWEFPTRLSRLTTAAVSTAVVLLMTYWLLACTVGSLGMMIGALGASFEQQHHFQHVVFVDEEV